MYLLLIFDSNKRTAKQTSLFNAQSFSVSFYVSCCTNKIEKAGTGYFTDRARAINNTATSELNFLKSWRFFAFGWKVLLKSNVLAFACTTFPRSRSWRVRKTVFVSVSSRYRLRQLDSLQKRECIAYYLRQALLLWKQGNLLSFRQIFIGRFLRLVATIIIETPAFSWNCDPREDTTIQLMTAMMKVVKTRERVTRTTKMNRNKTEKKTLSRYESDWKWIQLLPVAEKQPEASFFSLVKVETLARFCLIAIQAPCC